MKYNYKDVRNKNAIIWIWILDKEKTKFFLRPEVSMMMMMMMTVMVRPVCKRCHGMVMASQATVVGFVAALFIGRQSVKALNADMS